MSVFDDIMGKMFGDIEQGETLASLFPDPLSSFLPFRSFDPKRGFYGLEEGFGFVLDITGNKSDDALLSAIVNLIASNVPPHTFVQVVNYRSPNLSKFTDQWKQVRMGTSPVFDEMVMGRVDHTQAMAYGSVDERAPVPFDVRILLAVWTPKSETAARLKSFEDLRAALEVTFKISKRVEPDEFLSFLLLALNASTSGARSTSNRYDPHLSLSEQICGVCIERRREGLRLEGQEKISAAAGVVIAYPREWSFDFGRALLGSSFDPIGGPKGPVLQSMLMYCQSKGAGEGQILKKRAMLEHYSSKPGFGRLMKDVAIKREELDRVALEFQNGGKLFQTVHSVVAYAKGDISAAERALQRLIGLYAKQGVELKPTRYMHLPVTLGALPLVADPSFMTAARRAGSVRLMKGSSAAAFLPLHFEIAGNFGAGGLILVGRQGQIGVFDNFMADENYNVCVLGTSGSGKSVLMQDMVCGVAATGGCVLVIDDGYSFQNTAHMLEGTFIDIGAGGADCLNPFSVISQASVDQIASGEQDALDFEEGVIELVTNVVVTMVDLSGKDAETRVVGIEEDRIARAVEQVWRGQGRGGSIDAVRSALADQSHKDDKNDPLVEKLARFCTGGVYGKMFNGEATLSLDSAFTVVELSHVKQKRGLQPVILQIVMFMGYQMMFHTPRSQRVAICFDEAWDMLGGAGMANFIGGLARRLRKYNGALFTGTQNYDDFAEYAGAQACFDNSSTKIYMKQSPAQVDKREDLDPAEKAMLKSLIKVEGLYSELAIQAGEGWICARLIMDPFSIGVFSSKGETFERLKALRQSEGLTMAEAIRKGIEEGWVI